MNRVMLNRWAETLDDRNAIIAFWEHLESIGEGMDINLDGELNRHFGIDAAQLERERSNER